MSPARQRRNICAIRQAMRDMGLGSFIVAAWGGFLAYVLFAVAFDFGFSGYAVCITADEHCLREWIGALSGWAAAAGALIAAAITLPHLKRQADESRRQTDFLVGSAPPTASLFDPRETRLDTAYATRLDVVNWNRNPVLIRGIELEESVSGAIIAEISIEDFDAGRRNRLTDEFRRGRMYLPGWVDRSKCPTVAEFWITFNTSDDEARQVAINHMVRGNVRLRIDCHITGEAPLDIAVRTSKADALIVVD